MVKHVSIDKFQLLGAVCLLISSKYEEEKPLPVNDLVIMCANAWPANQIIKAEKFVLTLLDWNIAYSGPLNFLRRISRADECNDITRVLAKYLLEVTFFYEYFLKYTPSMIAAGSMYLSGKVCFGNKWIWVP
jgi:hypothetical protein